MPRMPADSADEEDSRSSAFSDEEPEVVKVEPLSTKKSKGRPRKEKAQTPPPAKEEEEEDNEEEEEEDDDDEEEDVYVVERIINHMFVGDELKFHVRWKDYPDLKDHTWEPEENLEAASEILDEYIQSVGGREALAKVPRPKKRGRAPSTNGKGTPSEEKNGKRAKKLDSENVKQEDSPGPKQPKLPPGNWEDLIANIDTMDRQVSGLYVLLTFKDGTRIRQLASVVYKRCPQKMLQFYESHLSITHPSRAVEESTNVEI